MDEPKIEDAMKFMNEVLNNAASLSSLDQGTF